MSNNSQIDTACRLLQQAYDRLTGVTESQQSKLDFEEVYSNALMEFAGKQEILWAIVFGGHLSHHPHSVASHLRENIANTASKNAEQLIELNQALTGVCPVLYLKGACLMVEDEFRPAPWRSMTDIDFLIPREQLDGVLDALDRLGYRTNGEKYTEALHAHYPMLKKEGCDLGVEVHTRLFRWETDSLLNPKEICEGAEVMQTQFGPIKIPQINHRIIHLIIHAQIASNRFARREFLMRDALEFRILSSRVGADLDLVRQKFKSAGYESEFLSFVGMADRIMNVMPIDPLAYRTADATWIDQAWLGIQNPETLVGFRRNDVVRNIVASAFTPSRWSAIAQALSNGDEFSDLVHRVRKAFSRR